MKIIALIFSFIVLSSTGIAQNILVDGQLPNDLRVTINNTGTIQFANYTRYMISVDGTVGFEYTSIGLPIVQNNVGVLMLKGHKPVKPPRAQTKKDKLARKQLLELAKAIEKSTFFDMNDSYYGNPDAQFNCVNHADGKAISVTANQKTKNVYFFLGCGYGEYDPLKKFLILYQQIEQMISGVKVKEVQPQAKP